MRAKLIAPEELVLCNYCIEREGIRRRGKRTKQKLSVETCDICDGLLSNLQKISEEAVRLLSEYEFDTFLVGTAVPQSILDSEDELRSKLKIKGKESVKSQITKIVSQNIAKMMVGKRIDYSRPDLTLLISPGEGTVAINPRSVWLSARYRKTERGFPQRSKECPVCNGLGCAECNYLGRSKNSVQGIINSHLLQKFEAESCNFIWLGSEDEKSLVLGSGRPFFVEIVRPKKRNALGLKRRSRSNKKNLIEDSGVEVLEVSPLEKRISTVPHFDVVSRVYLTRRKDREILDPAALSEQVERNFTDANVNVRLSRKQRIVSRRIISASLELHDDGGELVIDSEGGIPIKKLITGKDESVEPNLSGLLSAFEIHPEMPFDVLEVRVRPVNTQVEGSRMRKPQRRKRVSDHVVEERRKEEETEQQEDYYLESASQEELTAD